MSAYSMVVAIVAIVMTAKLIMLRQKARADRHSVVEPADTMRLREDVRVLKERIQVLERVITDDRKSIDLDREIERLRDH